MKLQSIYKVEYNENRFEYGIESISKLAKSSAPRET